MYAKSKLTPTTFLIITAFLACDNLLATDPDDEKESKSKPVVKTPITHSQSLKDVRPKKPLLPKSTSSNSHSKHSGDLGSTSSSPNSSFLFGTKTTGHVSFETSSHYSEVNTPDSQSINDTGKSSKKSNMESVNEAIEEMLREAENKRKKEEEKKKKVREEWKDKKNKGASDSRPSESQSVGLYCEEYKKMSSKELEKELNFLKDQKNTQDNMPEVFDSTDTGYRIKAIVKIMKYKPAKPQKSSSKNSSSSPFDKIRGFFK